MDISFSQNMQQNQKLILTDEMIMSLHILQMPITELQECIQTELNENPILEIDYDVIDESMDLDDNNSINEKELFDYDKFLQNNSFEQYKGEISYSDPDDDYDNNPLNYISKAVSLKDYLREQLIDKIDDGEIRDICEYLIELINEDGFITEDVVEISIDLSKPDKMIKTAIDIIKDFQPWGIGAKDFRESLIIQLKKKNCYDEKIEVIIMKHLELLADNKHKELSKLLEVTIERIQQYINTIKSLEPKPVRGFYTGEQIGYVVPEAFLKKIGNDYYIVMNDNMLPRLNVNSYYQRIMKESGNQETVRFMKNKVNSALTLMKGIEQRRKTIYQIIEKIIIYQKEYLDKGDAYLRPMNLNDLATQLNLHVSTVSRAIKDKYISLPMGTIRLKDFFTNGISSGAEDISTNIIKKEIERVIKEENKQEPLSDQAICEMLINENMNISRRTVAKYRDELGIRPSNKRKIIRTK